MTSVDRSAVEKNWRERGFSCGLWVDPPGQVWADYVHDVDELVMVIEGDVEFEIDGKAYRPSPLVDVPVDVLSGAPASSGIDCSLFGSTTPLPPARLAARYASFQAYLDAFIASADATIAAGFVLPEDRDALLAAAQPSRVGN